MYVSFLIEEVPRESKVDGHWVDRIVWGEEHVAASGIDVCYVDIEAAAFEVKVGIDVHDGIFSYLYSRVGGVLYGKHANGSEVVRSIVGGEEAYVATELYS